MTTLQANRLCGGYGTHQVVGPVDLEIEPGTCVGILGPNGAGKSTLLRLLAGILPARAGEVLLLGRSLTAWRRREVAQVVGFVPQSLSVAFPLTVLEMVMQGRAPHLGAWQPAGPADEAAVEAALHEVGLGTRRNVGVHTMSGGERQLVLLARALAGQPRLLLMDEPATGLDVRHQLALVDTVRRLVTTGVGAAVVLHDWNLAARLADRVLILQEGRAVASGPSREVLLPEILGRVFGVTVDCLPAPGVPVLVPRSRSIHPPVES